ncbi:uncharacterized protein LOC142775100 [Rhipicephalus microplus]|uniref:uncharacterized protein LOC142775100 n=1 Tax=Rhipicephalus microplus TaxID=6941 RepID=UPI003F6B5881
MRAEEFCEVDEDGVEKQLDPPPAVAPKSKKSITRFLLRRLCDRRYGEDLEWTDEERGIFRIRWSAHPWISQRKPEPVELFKDWSIKLKRWTEEDRLNLTKAKTRVRLDLLSAEHVEKLKRDDKSYRWFKIDNRPLLDEMKHKVNWKQQKKNGNPSRVKYCAVHKTDYAPCCCQCSTWSEPLAAVFEDQKDGTYACEEFELFSTQQSVVIQLC